MIGAGGFGREVLDVIQAKKEGEGGFHFLGFVDDAKPNMELLDRRVARWLGTVDAMVSIDAVYAIGIGDPATRRAIDTRLREGSEACPALSHPHSSCGADVELGRGSVVAAGARLTTNIRAGRHLHLNMNATIGHDCVIGDFVTINPCATVSGNVLLGDAVTVGTGANILQGVTVGPGAIVGAGSVVLRDVGEGTTVFGVPARPITR